MPDAGDAGRSIRKLPDAPWSAHCCARPTVSLQTLERSHEYVRACVQTDRKACVQTDRRADGQACVQTDRRACRKACVQTDRRADGRTGVRAERRAERRACRRTGVQKGVRADGQKGVRAERRAERRACRRTGVQTDRRASLAQTDRHAQEVTAIHRRSLLPLTTLNTTAERKGEGRERRRKIYEGGVHLTQRCGSRVM
jgi:hypothetical protein